jgi:hypothetical protein
MSKSQNRSIRNMTKWGNMTSQKINNHTTKDPMNNEENETSVSELKRIMIIVINEMKETCKKVNEITEYE